MSSVPVTCPHCYKTIHASPPTSDGLVRCDGCGHAFPSSGIPAGKFTPPSFNSGPSLPPYSVPVGTPGSKYAPSYPPANGPQKPGNPGMVACGVIVGLGFLGLLCCGGFAGALYYLVDEQLVADQEVKPLPITPPAFNPPPFNPPDFHSPELKQPIFNPSEPRPLPEIAQPAFPEVPTVAPFQPPTSPGFGLPGTPEPPPPSPKTIDDFITAMGTIDPTRFTARQLLDEFNALPVDTARRKEVVEAVLGLFKRAGIHARGLLAGPGETTLENWASETEATTLAEFAAGDANQHARRPLLKVLANIGGDAETAKALLPLINDPGMTFTLPDVFAKIGPEAEAPLLTELETANRMSRRTVFASLGKVGGAKSKAKLQALVDGGEGFDKVFGAQALNEIQSREGNNP